MIKEQPNELRQWQGLPYNPISGHYAQVFGEKVHKIPVAVAATCPNREGLNGMKTCNFCDVWGSAAYEDLVTENLDKQIIEARARVKMRVNRTKFLIYFQAYTTTFARVAELRTHIATAMKNSDIVGFVVGTRPDCLSDALYELLNEWAEKCYVAVELGVQTFDEDQLIWMRRGHSAERSRLALRKLHEKTNVNVGIHLMFGLPGETLESIVQTAKICNDLPMDNVKLHNLHVLKHTPLADDFAAGKFTPISLEDYAERVALFLQHLRPDMHVHRLAAVANRRDELIEPKWTGHKMRTHQFILDFMKSRSAFQGEHYVAN